MSTADLIDQLAARRRLSAGEFATVLGAATDSDRWHAARRAAATARGHFGNRIYVRGLIEFSNHCVRDCLYCGIRRGNRRAPRYRLTRDEILARCATGYQLGMRTFVLQSGEDPGYSDDAIVGTVASIRDQYPDCAVTLSVGERSRQVYQRFFAAGAERFLLRHETANAGHYALLHPPQQTHANRMRCLRDLKSIGFQTGAGLMVGSPHQTIAHLAEDLAFLSGFRPEMVGIGPFLPHRDTPLGEYPAGSVELTLFLLSLVRLALPTALIPATTALGTASASGAERGILAGANVLMPILTPAEHRGKYQLYDLHGAASRGGAGQAGSVRRLAARVAGIGYEIVTDRGDHPGDHPGDRLRDHGHDDAPDQHNSEELYA